MSSTANSVFRDLFVVFDFQGRRQSVLPFHGAVVVGYATLRKFWSGGGVHQKASATKGVCV